MTRAVAGYREVSLELEEHPRMVGLEIRLEKGLMGLDRLGVVLFVHNLRSGTDANCCCK